MPPALSALVEPGREFWGRYPELVKQRMHFTTRAPVTDTHDKYLSDRFFPIVGAAPKAFSGKNRRRLDMSIAMFESETSKDIPRLLYDLPIPNLDASYKSLAKYAKTTQPLDDKMVETWNLAADYMARHFGPFMQGSRVLSYQEAEDALDKTTSCGVPFNKLFLSKQELLDSDFAVEFRCYMERDWDALKDPLYTTIFGNALKEEIRPTEKIARNSIRTFVPGAIDFTIHGTRLFKDMNDKFYAAHLKTASVVGFSPFYGGWDRLYRKLKRHARGFALDESEYDSSIRAFILWTIARFRYSCLRPEDQTPDNLLRLLHYYSNLINSVIMTAEGILVRKKGGNPSGSVNTITDNTLILFMLLTFAWIWLAPEGKKDLRSFLSNVSMGLCGDDNTWTASEEALKFFNARTIIPVWAKLGITTTTDCMEPRPVEELDFLSQHTVFVEGVAIPLPEREKLLTSLLYTEHPNNPTMTLVRAGAYLRVAWADKELCAYLRELCTWLINHYGDVLIGDIAWEQALADIPSEDVLRSLHLGDELMKQSLLGKQIKIIKPNKKTNITKMSEVAVNVAPKGRRQRRGGKPAPVKVDVEVSPNMTKPQRNRVVRRRYKKATRRNLRKINKNAAPYTGLKGITKKMHRHLVRKGVNLNRNFNLYEQMLVDPFNGPLVAYPDEFSNFTRVIRLLTQKKLAFTTAGECSGRVYADPLNHLELDNDGVPTAIFLPAFANTSALGNSNSWFVDKRMGLKTQAGPKPLKKHSCLGPGCPECPITTKVPEDRISVFCGQYAGTNTSAVFFCEVGDSSDSYGHVQPLLEFPIDGDVYKAIHCSPGDTITVQAGTQNTTGSNFAIFCGFVLYSGGVYTTVDTPSASNPLTGVGTAVAAVVTAPANAVGVYSYTISNLGLATAACIGAQVHATMTQASGIVRHPAGRSNYGDVNQITNDSENARVVAMAALYQNRSQMLVKEGDIVHGQFPMEHEDGLPAPSLENYTAIPYSFNGRLEHGGYCWWRPYNAKSMEFKCLEEEKGTFDPQRTEKFYFFMAVSAANAASQNIVFLSAMIIEAETPSRVLGATPSLVNPLWIWEANALLAYVPQAMENDTHWKELKKLLSGAAGKLMLEAGKWMMSDGLPMLAEGFQTMASEVGVYALSALMI